LKPGVQSLFFTRGKPGLQIIGDQKWLVTETALRAFVKWIYTDAYGDVSEVGDQEDLAKLKELATPKEISPKEVKDEYRSKELERRGMTPEEEQDHIEVQEVQERTANKRKREDTDTGDTGDLALKKPKLENRVILQAKRKRNVD